jgi:hypothetical protein
LNREEFLDGLKLAPDRLRRATSGLTPEAARRRAASGEWSVIELVCHLRDYAEIFDSRIVRALNEDNPEVATYDNEDMLTSREYTSQQIDRVLDAHAGIRRRMLSRLAALDDARWARTVRHATWGQPSLEWLMNRCAEHELEHLEDISKVRAELMRLADRA